MYNYLKLYLNFVCLIITLLLGFTYCHESTGFTIEVLSDEKICFYEDFEGTSMYIFEFKVLRGGNYDIDVEINSPVGDPIYRQVEMPNDEFKFQISWGTFKFCFSNEFSSKSHKTIYFELRPEEHGRLANEAGKKAPAANTYIEELTENIHLHVVNIMKYQLHYRRKEAKGRNIAEILRDHVQNWSIVHAIIILLVGLGELFIVKMFFTEKRKPFKYDGVREEVVHALPATKI